MNRMAVGKSIQIRVDVRVGRNKSLRLKLRRLMPVQKVWPALRLRGSLQRLMAARRIHNRRSIHKVVQGSTTLASGIAVFSNAVPEVFFYTII
jgi:hypothetical protein